MRILADSIIVVTSLAIGVLFGLFGRLGVDAVGSSSDILLAHVEFFLRVAPPLGLVSIALLSLAGVYHTKPVLTWRQKAFALAQSVTIAYAVLLVASPLFAPDTTLLSPLGIIVAAYLVNVAGCIGARTAKFYVWQNFHVQPKNPPVEKPVEKVLVIGGAGYIGSVLVRKLLAAGYEVRVLDLLIFGDEPIRDLLPHPCFELIRGDFRRVDAVIHAVRGMDAVIHLGAIVGDPACALDEETTLQTNYAATALVADVCKGQGVSRFVFASTCSVYGASDSIVDETSALNPVSLYAATKIDSERILLASRSDRFHPTILRLGTAFGWSYRPRFDLVVNLLTAKAYFEKKVVIYNEEQWRPFVHVNDIARAFHKMLDAPLAQVSGEIFNVGSADMNHRLGDVGRAIHAIASGVNVVKEANADRRNYRVSFEKIHERLAFECETPLDDGIREIHRHLETGRIPDYTSVLYHNHKSVEQNGNGVVEPAVALKLISERFAARKHEPSKLGVPA